MQQDVYENTAELAAQDAGAQQAGAQQTGWPTRSPLAMFGIFLRVVVLMPLYLLWISH